MAFISLDLVGTEFRLDDVVREYHQSRQALASVQTADCSAWVADQISEPVSKVVKLKGTGRLPRLGVYSIKRVTSGMARAAVALKADIDGAQANVR